MLLCDSATVYIMLTYDEQINFTQLEKSKRNLELLEQGKDNPCRSLCILAQDLLVLKP